MRWQTYILHLLIGVFGAIMLCWFVWFTLGIVGVSDAHTFALGPSFALPLTVGALVGALAASLSGDALGRWAWLPLILYLSWGLTDSAAIPGGTLKAAFAVYFGAGCGDSDCLGQVLVTIPFMVSVGYSLGAYFYFVAGRK